MGLKNNADVERPAVRSSGGAVKGFNDAALRERADIAARDSHRSDRTESSVPEVHHTY